jgi:SAM-dependent methyltransferase
MLRSIARTLLSRLRHRGLAAQGPAPTNYGAVHASPQRITSDLEYALRIAKGYAASLPGGFEALRGRSVLEIGPGTNLASALILKCSGATRVVVTDRFLVRYQETYHGPLYLALRNAVARDLPQFDPVPVDVCLASHSHSAQAVECVEMPLERFAERFAGQFDVVFSNAVLEHVYDPEAAAESLFAVTADDGSGFHQVDFRDHRDFSRPLEYLLLGGKAFQALLEACHCECGNRIRPHELAAMFLRAGFARPSFSPNMWAQGPYLQEFIPRLRAAKDSPYRDAQVDDLKVISGQFQLRKPARPR